MKRIYPQITQISQIVKRWKNRAASNDAWLLPGAFALLLLICGIGVISGSLPPVEAAATVNVQSRPVGVVTSSEALTVAGVTIDSSPVPSTNAREMQIQWTFGTVAGTYTTCTAQAKTTYDGSNYLTLGSAAALIVTSGAVNAWTIIEQLGTTSVTTSAVSAAAALGFGQATKFTLACSGAYGTSAPVTISVIYR